MSFIKISKNILTLNWIQAGNHRYIGQFLKDENGVLYKLGKDKIEKILFKEYYITNIKLEKNIGVKYSEKYKKVYPETINEDKWFAQFKIKLNNDCNKTEYNISLYPYN